MDGNTKSRPDLSKEDTVDGGEPQDKSNPPMKGSALRNENTLLRTKDKPSLFERAVRKSKKHVKGMSVLAL